MSKAISMRDIMKFPQFKEIHELQLAHPSFDKAIAPFVHLLGIDTRQSVEYIVNNHRDLSNNTGIGIRIVGEIRRDAEFVKSPVCDLVDRIVIAGLKDVSLAEEMESLTRQVSNIQALADQEGDSMQELIEDDFEWSTMQIKSVEEYIKSARGGTNVVNYNIS